jgi:hypothetical protein
MSYASVIVSNGPVVFMDYFIKAFDHERQTKFTIMFRENTEPPKLKNSLGTPRCKAGVPITRSWRWVHRECCPFAHHEDIWGNGGKAPLILNIGTRRWWVVSFRGPASSPPGNNLSYPTNMRLGDRCLVTDKRFTKLYKSVNKCVEQTNGNGACRRET